jgi:hypothetical protein
MEEPKKCDHCNKETDKLGRPVVLYRFRMTNDFLCWECNWEWR